MQIVECRLDAGRGFRQSAICDLKSAMVHILGVVRARITAAFFLAGSSTPCR